MNSTAHVEVTAVSNGWVLDCYPPAVGGGWKSDEYTRYVFKDYDDLIEHLSGVPWLLLESSTEERAQEN